MVAHRFASRQPTGIGRYYVELARALVGLQRNSRPDYDLASPAEPARPDWLTPGLSHRTIPGNRQALLLSWCLTGRPLLDTRIGNPDLIHVLHPWVPIPSTCPLVATVHDLMPILHPEWYGRRERWAYRRGIDHLAEHATAVVANSRWVADTLVDQLDLPSARITVIPLGIGPRFHAATALGRAEVNEVAERNRVVPGRYLVAIGTVSDRKNLAPLLRALAKLDRISVAPAPDLLVAGADGIGADRVRAQVEQLGLSDRVRFASYVADEDLPALLAGSLALVHPSLDEGFGLTPLEAMAAGTVAIASTAGSLPEVVQDAGLLVSPHEPDAWAGAITQIRDDPERRAALVAAGRSRAEQFSWAAAARQHADLHLEVLSRP